MKKIKLKKKLKNKKLFDLQIIIAFGRRDIEKITIGLVTALSSAYRVLGE
jgi:hypothetical protein